jgi:hydroxymethylbilane synthase
MKDVPAHLPDEFVLPVIAFRDDVRDALVTRGDVTLAGLPAGARVGSASLRRQSQLRAHRPDLAVAPVRGNVGTRLKKLDSGDYDALILASTGLDRLGLGARVAEHLPVETFVPAAGQGALGIECLSGADRVRDLIAALNDPEVSACVQAERTVSAGLGADCSAPLGAFAERRDGRIELTALLGSADGREQLRAHAVGTDPAAVGQTVVASLRDQGAMAILKRLPGG